jgi:DNA-binding XRE family transcriptional regulator
MQPVYLVYILNILLVFDTYKFHNKVHYFERFNLFLFIILNVMKLRRTKLLPRLEEILGQLGENIKLARLRRRLTSSQVCERAGIAKATLWSIEKGSPAVAMGTYLQVLFVLGLEKDVLKIAVDDELGRKLQDINLIIHQRGPKKS